MSAVSDKSRDAIMEEAAEWIVRLSADDVPQEDLRAFVAWLKRSPVHVREYLHLETTWVTLGTVDPSKRIDVEALLANADANVVELTPRVRSERDGVASVPAPALTSPGTARYTPAGSLAAKGATLERSPAAEEDPVARAHSPVGTHLSAGAHSSAGEQSPAQAHALADSHVHADTQSHAQAHARADAHLHAQAHAHARVTHGAQPSVFTRSRRLAIAACLVLIVAGIALFNWQFADRYVTGVGEQRTLKLADGSTVVLNTDTTLRLNFTHSLREVRLSRGEALFSVAKDRTRPFRVVSDRVIAQAVGTSFVVRRTPQQTVVTVIEGKVAVADSTQMDRSEPASVPRQAVVVTAGERADVAGQAVRTETIANTAAVTAWRSGRLIFDGQPLSEVVSEFNRYNKMQIVLDDPELSAERISGVFDASQPRSLVRFLEASGSIEPVQSSPDTIYLQPRR